MILKKNFTEKIIKKKESTEKERKTVSPGKVVVKNGLEIPKLDLALISDTCNLSLKPQSCFPRGGKDGRSKVSKFGLEQRLVNQIRSKSTGNTTYSSNEASEPNVNEIGQYLKKFKKSPRKLTVLNTKKRIREIMKNSTQKKKSNLNYKKAVDGLLCKKDKNDKNDNLPKFTKSQRLNKTSSKKSSPSLKHSIKSLSKSINLRHNPILKQKRPYPPSSTSKVSGIFKRLEKSKSALSKKSDKSPMRLKKLGPRNSKKGFGLKKGNNFQHVYKKFLKTASKLGYSRQATPNQSKKGAISSRSSIKNSLMGSAKRRKTPVLGGRRNSTPLTLNFVFNQGSKPNTQRNSAKAPKMKSDLSFKKKFARKKSSGKTMTEKRKSKMFGKGQATFVFYTHER
jgi:hypothetical protein